MKISDIIAVIALIVSLISLYQSKKSLDQSRAVQSQSQRNQIDDAKTELLGLISDCKFILNTTRIDIAALKAEFDAESQPVQVLLHNFTDLFNSYLPNVETALHALTSDWNAVNAWSGIISFSDLMRKKARIQDVLQESEIANNQAIDLVEAFREKLQMARKHSSSATM